MSATTGNFIDGGEIDPFPRATGAPLTLAEQAAMEERNRQRRVAESARNTANINNRRGGYNETAGRDYQDSVDASNRRVQEDRVDRGRSGKNMRLGFADALSRDPVTMGVLAGPLFATGAGAAFGGLGFGAGAGTIAAGEAVAPAITTGGAVTVPTLAAPTAVGATTGTTAAATAAPAADAAFTVGGALKEVAPILSAVAPFAIDAIAGGNTKEQDALIAKQKQMAQEAEARRAQVQESRMNALGQQLLAMNPSNQMMAQMFGPGAAYQPEQMAAMVQNPMPPPEMPKELQALEGNTKPLTPQQKAAYAAFAKQKQQYEQGNQQRTDMMMNGVTPPGPGPAPLQPRTPQPARKY